MFANRMWLWFEGEEEKRGSLEQLQNALADGRVSGNQAYFDFERYLGRYPFDLTTLRNFTLSKIKFNPSFEDFISTRKNHQSTVLSGANNSGKSLILKGLFLELDDKAYLIGTNRIYHVSELTSTRTQEPVFQQQFIQQFYQAQQNQDENRYQLQTIITSLKDTKRKLLFQLCEELLGNRFEIKLIEEDNEFTPRYIAIDGENLAVSSTGTRLLMTILGICLDERFDTLLIDEPELGLSPKIQSFLSSYLLDLNKRNQYFPHLKHVYIATHSHSFLDKRILANNFVVSKADNLVSIIQVSTISDYHNLQFNMLGNELESLFLPSAIVLVEGPCDEKYVRKLFGEFFPDKQIAIVNCTGDGVENKLHIIEQSLGVLSRSPYKDRVFIILDKVHSVNIEKLAQKIPKENIKVWPENGIEYYYPKSILAEIYHSTEEIFVSGWLEQYQTKRGNIEINGIPFSKNSLVDAVIPRLTRQHQLDTELLDFLELVRQAIQ